MCPVIDTAQVSFNQGEVGPFMLGRTDLEIYKKSAEEIENFLCLPHGGATYRRGFEFIRNLGAIDPEEVLLKRFDFNKEQQYLLIFTDQLVTVIRDKQFATSVVTPYAGADVRDLRFAQSSDSLIITHKDYPPAILMRDGGHTIWKYFTITFDPYPFVQYNNDQTLTPSSATTGGPRTYTLSGTTGYWKAGHAQNVKIKLEHTAGSPKSATLTGFPSDASGGTALSSGGTAGNAFDNNTGTHTDTGSGVGWIGYAFTDPTRVRIIGLNSELTGTYDFVLESDDDDAFPTPTLIATFTGISLTAGTILYLDVPSYVAETKFRVRTTSGSANFDLKELVLNKGLIASGSNDEALSAATAAKDWFEQGWGAHKGYPRTVSFVAQRLFFGGIRDEPSVIFASKVGSFFNFDDTDTTDNFSYKFFIDDESSHEIRNIRGNRTAVVVFSSDGEFIVTGGGTDKPITPTSIKVNKQSRYGCARIEVDDVDGELVYVTANKKEVRAFRYEFARDQYESFNLTKIAHHIFQDDRRPRRITVLRGYLDHQATYVCMPREDGQMAIATYDRTNTESVILAWSRFTTNLSGKFYDAEVVETTHRVEVGPIPTLYCVFQRTVDGTPTTFVEAMTEERVWLDHWYAGEVMGAQVTWSGLTTLANETVTVIGDGLVAGDFEVNGSGQFTLNTPVSAVVAGIGYTGRLKILPIAVNGDGGTIKGRNMMLKEAVVDLLDTMDLTINGYPMYFRSLGADLLDAPLQPFTGQKRIKIANLDGNSRNPGLLLIVAEPVPCTILTVSGRVKIGL